MDIEERIDGLTEAEAKAALLFIVKQEGRFMHDTRWILCKGQETIEECENQFLDRALKEARK